MEAAAAAAAVAAAKARARERGDHLPRELALRGVDLPFSALTGLGICAALVLLPGMAAWHRRSAAAAADAMGSAFRKADHVTEETEAASVSSLSYSSDAQHAARSLVLPVLTLLSRARREETQRQRPPPPAHRFALEPLALCLGMLGFCVMAGGAPDAVGVVHLAGWAVVIVFLEFDNDDFDPL
jgi:hypothetical protein